VLIRTRNPWAFARWRVFGWNVLLPFISVLSLRNGIEPSMLANAFRECQCNQVCATVCVLRRYEIFLAHRRI
jgi:hypothetical protein